MSYLLLVQAHIMLRNNSFDMDSVDKFQCNLHLEGLKCHSYKDLVALTSLKDLILFYRLSFIVRLVLRKTISDSDNSSVPNPFDNVSSYKG